MKQSMLAKRKEKKRKKKTMNENLHLSQYWFTSRLPPPATESERCLGRRRRRVYFIRSESQRSARVHW